VVLLNVGPVEEEVVGTIVLPTVNRLYYRTVDMVAVVVKAVEIAMGLFLDGPL
jgi:hypothetical protein